MKIQAAYTYQTHDNMSTTPYMLPEREYGPLNGTKIVISVNELSSIYIWIHEINKHKYSRMVFRGLLDKVILQQCPLITYFWFHYSVLSQVLMCASNYPNLGVFLKLKQEFIKQKKGVICFVFKK